MNSKLRQYITALCICLAAFASSAQNVSIRVANQVIQGQRFTISISVTNGETNITRDIAPKLPGCTLIAGPGVSTMQSVQIVNGRQTSSVTREYTFTYTADKAGTVNIAPIKLKVDGKELSTQSKTLTILPPDQAPQNRNQGYGGYG